MKVLVGILVILFLIIVGSGWFMQNAADYQQAAAMAETARALRTEITANSITQVVMLVGLVFFGVLAIGSLVFAGILYIRVREAGRAVTGGKWVSGPNANFARVGASQGAKSKGLPDGVDLNTLITLLVIQQMQNGGRPMLPPAEPGRTEQIDDSPAWKW